MIAGSANQRRVKILVFSLLFMLPPSIAFGFLVDGGRADPLTTITAAATTMLLIATPILLFELWCMDGPGPMPRLKTLPLTPFLAVRFVCWAIFIFVGNLTANQLFWATPVEQPLIDADFWWTVGFSFVAAFTMQTAFVINELLGPGVLGDLLRGRYHRPQVEERAVCIIDLKGSTKLAETLGPVTFLQLLSRFATVVGEEIREAGGQVHSYVGDAVIVTWKGNDAHQLDPAIEALEGLQERLERDSQEWMMVFGTVPAFRAALHSGVVAAGEMGEEKRAIVLLGDTMNVAARLESAAKEAGVDLLVSGPVRERLSQAWQGRLTDLGTLKLRGREDPIAAYAVPAV